MKGSATDKPGGLEYRKGKLFWYQHSVYIESRHNLNIGLFISRMDYSINERNQFAVNEFIKSFNDGNAWPALTVRTLQ